ncbi:MAG: hypothetical protein B6D36_17720, partial [Planctomycetes bacterium UTPLA1]
MDSNSRITRNLRRIAALSLLASVSRPAVAQSPFLVDESAVQSLLPPGISDFNLELYGKLAYTWTQGDGVQVVQIEGDFLGKMGPHRLSSRDAVLWFRHGKWQDKGYLEIEVFLWQDAEVVQPAGTVESGPALMVTLRTFGKLVLNADGHASESAEDTELFREALKARRLVTLSPTPRAEEASEPVVISPSAEQLRQLTVQKPAKLVQFSVSRIDGTIEYETVDEESVVIARNDVLVTQGSPSDSGEYMELRADAAVLYLNSDQLGSGLPGVLGTDDEKKNRQIKPTDEAPDGGAPKLKDDSGGDKSDTGSAGQWVNAVYLEGDVVLTRGLRMIRAPRLYYDFQNEQALILDAVTRAAEPSRGIPIYVRADEIRQLSSTQYEANKAQITTSEFHTPHVAIGADKVVLTDRTPRNAAGDIVGIEAGTYKAYHTTLNLEGLPIAYWPFSRGDFSRDRMAFRSAKTGYNGDFGATFETRWYLFNLLGLETPEGYDATYKLDYFTDRGPATGIDMDYERDDYYG